MSARTENRCPVTSAVWAFFKPAQDEVLLCVTIGKAVHQTSMSVLEAHDLMAAINRAVQVRNAEIKRDPALDVDNALQVLAVRLPDEPEPLTSGPHRCGCAPL